MLPALYGTVQVPQAVASELAEGMRRGIRLPDLAALPWLSVRAVQDRTLLSRWRSRGAGEREVLALGREAHGALLVLDDRAAVTEAKRASLDYIGTLGILVLAKGQGLLELTSPILDHLDELGFWLSAATRRAVLHEAGE